MPSCVEHGWRLKGGSEKLTVGDDIVMIGIHHAEHSLASIAFLAGNF